MTRRQKVLAIVTGLVGVLLATSLFSTATFVVSGLKLSASVGYLDGGLTEVSVPPLGSIRAATHLPPLKYRVELRSVDPDRLEELVKLIGSSSVSQNLRDQLAMTMQRFFLRLFVIGLIGSAVGPIFLGVRSRQAVGLAIVAGFVFLTTAVGTTALSYDVAAFEQPEFTGALAAAPWMVGLAEQGASKIVEFSQQMKLLTSNLYRFFASVKKLEALGEVQADRTILVVSDIHNNPGAISMIDRVVDTFSPDFIIDAGDISDYGTRLEYEGLKGLGDLGLPYILVPGNHDSPTVLDQLATLPNVTVLGDTSQVVEGVRLYGVTDPSARSSSPAVAEQTEVEGRVIAARYAFGAVGEPFIFIAHDPRIAEPFYNGEATRLPVVISGHSHHLSVRTMAGQVWLDPGSTGAAGIRGLMSRNDLPYSVVLLYLQRVPGGGRQGHEGLNWKTVAIDTMKVSNLQGSFTIQRQLVNSE